MRKIKKFLQLIRHTKYIRALFHGVAAAIEHEKFLHYLKNEDINYIVDIGANVGQFSLAVRQILPQARILSFEPLTECAQKYQTLFHSDHMISFFQKAIGPTPAEVNMHVSESADSSSLLEISELQNTLFPGTAESHQEKVIQDRLDSFIDIDDIPETSVLKIDVQGYELEVLKGCESLLQKFRFIYVECSFMSLYQNQALAHEVISWLLERNFHLSGIGTPLVFDNKGQSIQGDFIFSKGV